MPGLSVVDEDTIRIQTQARDSMRCLSTLPGISARSEALSFQKNDLSNFDARNFQKSLASLEIARVFFYRLKTESVVRYELASIEQELPHRLRCRMIISLLMIVAFAAVTLHSSSAYATCGDYLSHSHELTFLANFNRDHESSDPGQLFGVEFERSHSSESKHKSAPIPCGGPNCQRTPTHSPLPSPIMTLDHHDRWLSVVVMALETPDECSSVRLMGERVPRSLFSFRLERPPKQV